MKLKFELEYSDKTSCFDLELFFKRLQKIFYEVYDNVQGIWEGPQTQGYPAHVGSWSYDTQKRCKSFLYEAGSEVGPDQKAKKYGF